MRAVLGCPHCSYVERSPGNGDTASRECPECGFPLRSVDLLGQQLMARERLEGTRMRSQISDSMVEQARRARLLLR